MTDESTTRTVTVERDGHVLLMGLNRPAKRNAFTLEMLAELSLAYAELEANGDLPVGVLFAHGEHFTGGLDLVDVGPAIAGGRSPYPPEGRDPWRLDGTWTKPVVAQDVKYAIDRALLPGVPNGYIGLYLADVVGLSQAQAAVKKDSTKAPDISGITTPDSSTVVIKLTKPSSIATTPPSRPLAGSRPPLS